MHALVRAGEVEAEADQAALSWAVFPWSDDRLAVIDCDVPGALAALRSYVVDTSAHVLTGRADGSGVHVYVLMPEGARLPTILYGPDGVRLGEIRRAGSGPAVLPGQPHVKTGRYYTASPDWRPGAFPVLSNNAVRALCEAERVARRKAVGQDATDAAGVASVAWPDSAADVAAGAAIVADPLAAMAPGSGRSCALFAAALELRRHGVTEADAWPALALAFERNGMAQDDGQPEVRRVFANGWRAGDSAPPPVAGHAGPVAAVRAARELANDPAAMHEALRDRAPRSWRTAAVVLDALADTADEWDRTTVYPGDDGLRIRTGLGARTIRRARLALEAAGVLLRVQRQGRPGQLLAAAYDLADTAKEAQRRLPCILTRASQDHGLAGKPEVCCTPDTRANMHERRHYAVSGAWPASLRPSNADVAVHPSSKMARKVARMHAAGRHDGAAELRATFLAGRGLTGAAVLAALTVAGELTAEDAASAAGCHRTTAARHLDAAVDAGVAYTRTEATTGRPRTVYVLAATEAETLGIGGAASGYVLANAHKTVRDAKADRAWANRMVLDGAVATFGEAVEEVRAARQFERTTPDRGRVDPVRLGEAVGAVACHLRRMRGEDSEADQAAPVRARSRPPDAEAAIDACMVGAWA